MRAATTMPTARLRKQFPAATKFGSRRYDQAGRIAPRRASRNPETRKPASALPPPPDARVSADLPAMSTASIVLFRTVERCGHFQWLSESVDAAPENGMIHRLSPVFSAAYVWYAACIDAGGFWSRGSSALVGCLPPAQFAPRYGHHLPGSGDFFAFGRLVSSPHDGNLRSIHG